MDKHLQIAIVLCHNFGNIALILQKTIKGTQLLSEITVQTVNFPLRMLSLTRPSTSLGLHQRPGVKTPRPAEAGGSAQRRHRSPSAPHLLQPLRNRGSGGAALTASPLRRPSQHHREAASEENKHTYKWKRSRKSLRVLKEFISYNGLVLLCRLGFLQSKRRLEELCDL